MVANALSQSVQDRQSNYTIRQAGAGMYIAKRGGLLPRRGSHRREYALWNLYYHDYMLLFRSAVAGLIKRVQSAPWEISGTDSDRYQAMLMDADFGNGWDSFLSRVLIPFFRADVGGFIEIIGPGDPRDALIGAPTGIASLNALNITLTGDPTYPVLYHSAKGWHKLHRSRVIQLADNVDSDYDGLVGYGDCALSRYAAAAHRDIYMSQYIESFLDDKPLPGFLMFKNLTADQQDESIERMMADMARDESTWGRTAVLTDMAPDQTSAVEHFAFQGAPEKFDFDQYQQLNVKLLALALGVDIQDIWELTGGGIGTGTQSQILAQKSKGKALGRLFKSIERVINQSLPRDVAFTFEYNDSDEDRERAEIANSYAQFVATMASTGVLSNAVLERIVINQVGAVSDAVRDLSTSSQRVDDADPQPLAADDSGNPGEDLQVVERMVSVNAGRIRSVMQEAYRASKLPLVPGAVARQVMLNGLREVGTRVYLDGKREGGDDSGLVSNEDRAIISRWLNAQTGYVRDLIAAFKADTFTDGQLAERASLWENKSLRDLYYTGVDQATVGGVMFIWEYDPTQENCGTCSALNGQIHKYATFKQYGFYPGAAILECGGWQCGCRLKPMPAGTRARGSLRRARMLIKKGKAVSCACGHDHGEAT